MTPEKFNEIRMSVVTLGALVADMPLEGFLSHLALAGADIDSDPVQLQNLEVLASSLLRVKEVAAVVRSLEERKRDLEQLRNVPSPVEEMESLVRSVSTK